MPKAQPTKSETLTVRPLRPSDADKYRSILESTSSEDRYARFFTFVEELTPQFIEPFVSANPDVIGLIAEDRRRPLGAVHAFLQGAGEAELGIVVAGPAQGRGVGRAMTQRLLEELEARRCRVLVARALNSNDRFARLAASIGMSPVAHEGGVTTWRRALEP